MNKRKIENWLIFCLKMLPFLFLIIFCIYIHRHDLPNDINYNGVIPFAPFVEGDTWIMGESELTIDNVYNTSINSYRYHYVLSATTEFAVYWNAERQQYFLEIVRPEGYESYYTDTVPADFILFNASLIDIEETDFYKSPLGTPPQSVVLTTNNIIEIMFVTFNDYLDNFYNFNFLNMTDFYNWTNKVWFHGATPLYYKPVFSLLVYELIIDFLILMYSFITFIIKFAQKWLNGIYNKDW